MIDFTGIPVGTTLPLLRALRSFRKDQRKAVDRLGDELRNDPERLARSFVEPRLQSHNPGERAETDPRHRPRQPAMEFLTGWLGGEFEHADSYGRNTMFIVADAGMGKTSLLVMLSLYYIARLWPSNIRCELLKLGEDSLERINAIEGKRKTVLLRDSLDEDPARGDDTEERILALMEAVRPFRRAIITCRTQYFPPGEGDPTADPGTFRLGGYISPLTYLARFDTNQVDEFLTKRFPQTRWQRLFRSPNPARAKARRIVDSMGALKWRPLTLSYVGEIPEDSAGDMFKVHRRLVALWLEREQVKLREKFGLRVSSQQLFDACQAVAVEIQKRRVQELPEDEIQALLQTFEGVGDIPEEHRLGRLLLNRNQRWEYGFAHTVIREFLVADWIRSRQVLGASFDLPMSPDALRFIQALAPRHIWDQGARQCRRCHAEMKALSAGAQSGRRSKHCLGSTNGAPWFSLQGVSCAGLRLDGWDLAGIDFTGASFARASLQGANLRDCVLDRCDFDGTNLSHADLRGSSLRAPGLSRTTNTHQALHPSFTHRL